MSNITNYYTNSSFTCQECNNIIKLYQPKDTIVISCPKCNNIHHTIDSEKNIIYNKIKNDFKIESNHLPLYAEGKIDGFNLKIIGIVKKSDHTSNWIEYQMIDQFGSSHVLSQWEGHYHLFQEISKDDYELDDIKKFNQNHSSIDYQNRTYSKLQYYKVSTIYLHGEFPYDPVNVKDIKIIDFIDPPYILSIETENNQNTVFKGVYLNRSLIKSAFYEYPIAFPATGTVGMAQPFMKGIDFRKINIFTMFFLGLFTILHIITSNLNENNIVLISDKTSGIGDTLNDVSTSFILPEKNGSYYLELTGQSNLHNQWIENVITLVNENTGEEREFSLGIEYYCGIDNGYTWSEGSDDATINISDVKPGKYHIKQKLYTSDFSSAMPFRLEVWIDSPIGWNYRFILFTTLIILILINLWRMKYEENRTGRVFTFFQIFFKK